MPCSDSRDHEYDNASQTLAYAQAIKKVDTLTDMLCRVGRQHKKGLAVTDKDILAWWEDHEKMDNERGETWDE